MSGYFVKAVGVLMAVVFPVSVWCADMRGAILNVSNSALVNGIAVTHSSAIFAGDRLQVPGEESGLLSLPGSSVVIAPGSALTFQSKALSLEPGSGVAVNTSTGLQLNAGDLTISPAHEKGKFLVARAGGNIEVIAKLGSVRIFDGSSTTVVAEGNTTSVADPTPQAPGATPGAETKGGVAVGKTGAIIAALIAAGVAAGIILATTGEPASSSRP